MSKKCTSCGIDISAEKHFSKFGCPGCGKVEIVRCDKCKMGFVLYKCAKCGFEGP